MVWNNEDKNTWFKQQVIKRSYQEVIEKIASLKDNFSVIEYGRLSLNPEKYPLFLITSKVIDPNKKNILITGGVHGYETSGVHGALRFLKEYAISYTDKFNIICAPCISPWAYETINRWNNKAIDPNRSFFENSPSEECFFVMKKIKELALSFTAHIDLHETTDTDNTIFRPALEARDGIKQEVWDIPDGFYLVGDSENPCHEFQKFIINKVKEVTHIAPSDKDGKIIGEDTTQFGVINYDVKKLNLCTGFSAATFNTTTEVYPDSPKTSPLECEVAQAVSVQAVLKFLIENNYV